MRKPIGARVEFAVGERRFLEHHRDRVGRARSPGQQTAPAASSARPRRAVSFHSRRMLWRSAAERMSRLPIERSGPATAASSSRTSRAANASMLPRSNRSVA